MCVVLSGLRLLRPRLRPRVLHLRRIRARCLSFPHRMFFFSRLATLGTMPPPHA